MQEIFLNLGMPILSAIIEPLLLLVVPPIVGWFVHRWNKLTGRELDREYADALHASLERAIKIGWRRYGTQIIDRRERDATVADFAASYVERFNRGTVKRFGLSHDGLKELAEGHLPESR